MMAAAWLGAVVAATSGAAQSSGPGPCDITATAGQPCVAAHSTVRALFASYDGPLYRLIRPNSTTAPPHYFDVGVLAPGGFANASAHDEFCGPRDRTDCQILNVFDQSEMKNHLGPRHGLVNASRHRISVGDGIEVYGMWFESGLGYHIDVTRGVAKGNEPESIYAVMSGSREQLGYGCCFDYGNSENSVIAKNKSMGAGAMEAIYFGNSHWMGNTGDNTTSDGPWIGADLEAGMYFGGGPQTKVNMDNKPLLYPFVSLYLRGGTDGFALKGGDATKGDLRTMYNGPRPDCAIAGVCERHENATYHPSYQPMHKQGAIVLATGGDMSNTVVGNFYEGLMTTGTTSDETDNAVQANIVAVEYKTIE